MIETLLMLGVGLVGVFLAVLGGSLLQAAIQERRLRRRMGDLATGATSPGDDLLRPTIAAALVLGAGVAMVAVAVVVLLS